MTILPKVLLNYAINLLTKHVIKFGVVWAAISNIHLFEEISGKPSLELIIKPIFDWRRDIIESITERHAKIAHTILLCFNSSSTSASNPSLQKKVGVGFLFGGCRCPRQAFLNAFFSFLESFFVDIGVGAS